MFQRPADVAWDASGNIYVADGVGNNARIAKFDKNGKIVKSWGSRGSAQGQFNVVHGIAIDAQGNVYVADSGTNKVHIVWVDPAKATATFLPASASRRSPATTRRIAFTS